MHTVLGLLVRRVQGQLRLKVVVCMVHRYIAVASQTEHQKLCYHHAIVLTSTKGSHRTGRNMSEISLYLKLFCHIQSFTSSEVHLPKSCEG